MRYRRSQRPRSASLWPEACSRGEEQGWPRKGGELDTQEGNFLNYKSHPVVPILPLFL